MGCTHAATERRRASINAHGRDARMQLYHVCRKCWQRKRAEQQVVTASMSRLHRALPCLGPKSTSISHHFLFPQKFQCSSRSLSPSHQFSQFTISGMSCTHRNVAMRRSSLVVDPATRKALQQRAPPQTTFCSSTIDASWELAVFRIPPCSSCNVNTFDV